MNDLLVTVSHLLDPGTVVQVEELRAAAATADGYDPLSEHKRMLLERPASGWPPTVTDGLVAVLARMAGSEAPIGYAQLNPSGADGALAIELVVSPRHRDPDLTVADALLGSALEAARSWPGPADGPGADGPSPARSVRYWSHHATDDDQRLAVAHGLQPERELIQMRRSLPMEGDRPEVTVRGFVPGVDEQPWLAVNNRAFASHPEQGAWDLDTLLEREREPWFDPEGLRLHQEGDRLAASCWTKVHTDTTPPMGEIYVISVDPDFRGRGLGRALTLAGLDWLAGVGLRVGMLYVDGDNQNAVSLYRSMGFTDHHVDRSFVTTVGGAGRT